jgi:hypothetical protein
MEDARGERKKEFSKPTPKVCSVVATSLWMIVNWLKELLANAACAQLLNLLSFLFLAFVVFTTSLSSNHMSVASADARWWWWCFFDTQQFVGIWYGAQFRAGE